MQTLYPAIKPYATYELAVDDLHTLYVEEVGNPQGIPVLILHAGPGGSGETQSRRYFDPERFRMILFDQRGCGRSSPYMELRNNTTTHLIQDIETLRQYFNLNRFILYGGGVGSLFALLYAQICPSVVSGLLLHRVFLGRQQDIYWFYQQGANLVYPDYWQEFTASMPESEKKFIPQLYAERLQSDNELARMAAAKAWATWRAYCDSLQVHQARLEQYLNPHFALCLATIESHYLLHNYFIKENQVFDKIHKLEQIPIYLIHGRYDMVCPLAGAWTLQQVLPHARLSIIRDAGHSEGEAGMIDALIMATKDLVHRDLDV